MAGFAFGFLSIAPVLAGAIDIESRVAALTPFADALYGLGLVIVIAAAAKAGVPMEYLAIAGIVMGVGLFFKSAPHEFHMASGLGFGLHHNGHVVMGTIVMTVSVAALAVLALAYNRASRRGDRR